MILNRFQGQNVEELVAFSSAVADGLSDIAARPQRESVVAKLVQYTTFARETATSCQSLVGFWQQNYLK